MKANELRIGNLILSSFDRVETVRMILGHEGYKDRADVHEIYKHLIGVEENRNQYNLAEIKPIPLTEDWLLSFGFASSFSSDPQETPASKSFRLNYFMLFMPNEENQRFIIDIPNVEIFYIKSVHQLQNLYFALTQTELTLTPPKK